MNKLIKIFYIGGESTKRKWDVIKDMAMKGELKQIADEDPEVFVVHYPKLRAIRADFATKPTDLEELENYWIYGPTGTGKSMWARTKFENDFYWKSPNRWWDGYQGEDNVLIDDFDISHALLGHRLKIWGDRYSFGAEIKGSNVLIRPKRVIITSNWHPSQIWTHSNTLDPILRRFKVFKLEKLGDEPIEDNWVQEPGCAPNFSIPKHNDSLENILNASF